MRVDVFRRFFVLALTLAVFLIAGAASAEAYRVRLINGNEFMTKYEPVPAPYDQNKLLIMTDVGNTIAVQKEEVAEIITDQEVRAFGRRIDTSTIEVGWSANDAPIPDQDGSAPSSVAPRQFAPVTQPVFNSPLVAEPNSGGGIPVSFANSGMMPMSSTNADPSLGRRRRNN